MSAAPKGFEPMYSKVYPVREARITLERIHVTGTEARDALASYRATVSDAATGARIFSMDRWGARTAILEASRRADAMGLTLTAGENRA